MRDRFQGGGIASPGGRSFAPLEMSFVHPRLGPARMMMLPVRPPDFDQWRFDRQRLRGTFCPPASAAPVSLVSTPLAPTGHGIRERGRARRV